MSERDDPTHCVLVDTNVLAVADDMHAEASDECRLACAQLLRRISDGQRLLVDTGDEILAEYLSALTASPGSGVGKKLAASLWRRRYDDDVCHRVQITPIDEPAGSFAEVPVALRDFDLDDQKFLAAAIAVGETPPIFQALDREWWERRVDLLQNGFDINFLCIVDNL